MIRESELEAAMRELAGVSALLVGMPLDKHIDLSPYSMRLVAYEHGLHIKTLLEYIEEVTSREMGG